LSSFPLHWEEEVQSLDQLPDRCPYPVEEIEQYLWWCHYHWMLDEKPMRYKVQGVAVERTENDRRFWPYQVSDETEREWYVVVGAGKSPLEPAMKMRGWMYGKENVLGHTPDRFLRDEIDEQHAADAR
jgi:hypothetical protein